MQIYLHVHEWKKINPQFQLSFLYHIFLKLRQLLFVFRSGKQNNKCPNKCSCFTSIDKRMVSNTRDPRVLIIDCSSQLLTSIPRDISSDVALLRLDGNNMKRIGGRGHHYQNFSTKVFFLNSSKIEYIGEQFFNSFKLLKYLYLQDNLLSFLPGKMFSCLSLLQVVTLHENKLQTLDLNEIRNKTTNLRFIKLSRNPWTCDCEFGKPFEKWIGENTEIVHDRAEIRCGLIQRNLSGNATSNHNINARNITSDYQDTAITTSPRYSVRVQNNLSVDSLQLYEKRIWDVDFDDVCVDRRPNPINYQRIASFSPLFLLLVAMGVLLFYYRMAILIWCYYNPWTSCLIGKKKEEEVRVIRKFLHCWVSELLTRKQNKISDFVKDL